MAKKFKTVYGDDEANKLSARNWVIEQITHVVSPYKVTIYTFSKIE